MIVIMAVTMVVVVMLVLLVLVFMPVDMRLRMRMRMRMSRMSCVILRRISGIGVVVCSVVCTARMIHLPVSVRIWRVIMRVGVGVVAVRMGGIGIIIAVGVCRRNWRRFFPPPAPDRDVRRGDAAHTTAPHALGANVELVGNVRHPPGQGGLHVREQCRWVGRCVKTRRQEHVAGGTRERIDVQPEGVGVIEGHVVLHAAGLHVGEMCVMLDGSLVADCWLLVRLHA